MCSLAVGALTCGKQISNNSVLHSKIETRGHWGHGGSFNKINNPLRNLNVFTNSRCSWKVAGARLMLKQKPLLSSAKFSHVAAFFSRPLWRLVLVRSRCKAGVAESSVWFHRFFTKKENASLIQIFAAEVKQVDCVTCCKAAPQRTRSEKQNQNPRYWDDVQCNLLKKKVLKHLFTSVC